MAERKFTVGILTVSDRCSSGETEDKSGPNLSRLVKEGVIPSAEVIIQLCVPDDEYKIAAVLCEWSDKRQLHLVLTTGGTGFSARDVTPEATRRVLHREAPGLAGAMLNAGLVHTPYAMLSRAVCGLRGRTVIINLPGSCSGAQQGLQAVAPALPHALALACGLPSTHSPAKVGARPPQTAAAPAVGAGASSGASSQEPGSTHYHHHHHRQHQHGDQEPVSKVKADLVARRQRNSPYPMLPVSEAQALVLTLAEPLPARPLPPMAALGRVLARVETVREPLPPFPASLKDGYAARSVDGAGPRSVVGSRLAGQEPGPAAALKPGECMRITTGAPLPPGADCVVQVEDTQLLLDGDGGRTELQVQILTSPVPGLDVRPVGSDMKPGQQLLAAGCVLGPAEVGVLAAAGVTEVLAHRLPTVALLSTGNELQPADAPGPTVPGCVRDSNKSTLLALLQQRGFPTVDLGIAPDDMRGFSPQSLLSRLREGLLRADVLVTTGGVSMGERDLLKPVLTTDLRAEIVFGRLNMKPGKPTTLAAVPWDGRRRLVLALPGNPVSALVTAHLLLLPALRRLAGHPAPLPTMLQAKIEEEMKLDPRPEYHRAILRWIPGEPMPRAKSTGSQASSRLLSAVGANALLVLPACTDSHSVLPAGSQVDALLLCL